MKKIVIVPFAILSLVLAACTPAGSVDDGSSSSSSVRSKAAASAASQEATGESRVVNVHVDSWAFSPSMITAKKGEKVTLRLVGKTGSHSFAIPGLSINQPIAAGETIEITLPTDTAGTFAFSCRIPCGEGHKDMKGSIVIEE